MTQEQMSRLSAGEGGFPGASPLLRDSCPAPGLCWMVLGRGQPGTRRVWPGAILGSESRRQGASTTHGICSPNQTASSPLPAMMSSVDPVSPCIEGCPSRVTCQHHPRGAGPPHFSLQVYPDLRQVCQCYFWPEHVIVLSAHGCVFCRGLVRPGQLLTFLLLLCFFLSLSTLGLSSLLGPGFSFSV